MTDISSPKMELPSEDNQDKNLSSVKWRKVLVILPIILLIIGMIVIINHKKPESNNQLDKHGTYYDDKFIGYKENGQQERSLIVYSQVRNVEENGTWKKLEDANSLKDSGLRFITIEKDSRYDYKILNWNASTLIFMPILTEERDLNREVAIKENGIVIQHFNYKNLDERITVTINGDILNSNFTVGDNSTTFKVSSINEGTANLAFTNRGNTEFDSAPSSQCCGQQNAGAGGNMFRAFLNFTLSQIPLGSVINSANLTIQIDSITYWGENWTIVSRNSTYTPPLTIGNNDADAFDGWKSGVSTVYGGVNTTVPISTSQFNMTVGNWINFSFSAQGLAQISNLTGKDFRIALLDEADIESRQAVNSRAIGVGDDFTTSPVLFINYTSPATNSAPTFNSGYPILNATDLLNSTFKNLTAVWIANDIDINDIEKYNITWYSDNKSNFTLKNLAYTRNTLNVDILNSGNLTIGQTWKAMINVCDNGSACVFANTSELLIINSPPTVPNIVFPVNNLLTANFTINLSCSGSTDPEGNVPIKYEYYMQNQNPPTSSFGNTTGDSLNNTIGADGTYFWRCRAFDSIGGASGFNDTRQFLADRRMVTENISNYIPTVLQGSLNHFSLNLTFNRSTTYDINATFTYNTTLYNVTKTNYKDNGRIFDIDISAPFATTSIPFSWNLTINQLNNTLIFNNSFTASQSLVGSNISNCSSPNANQALAVNFTLQDESNKTFLKSQFEATFNLWVNDQTVNTTIHFNQNDYSNATSVLLCISPPFASFKSEAEISYISNGYQARQYYFRNTTINNQTQIIPLYLLSDLLSSPINFNILDNVGNGLSNYILNVMSHDTGNNTLLTVAMGKSDFGGNSLIYLKKNDPNYPYRFSVLDNIGRNVFTSITDTFITGDITIRIAPSGSIIEFINALNNVQNSLTFSSGTSTYAYSYNDPSGKVATSTLKITRRSAKEDTVLLTKVFTGSSASFTYTLPSNDTGTYIATTIIGFTNDNGAITNLPLKTISNEIVDVSNKLYTSLKLNGILGTIFVIVTFAMLGITSSTLVIIFSLVGLVFMWFMGVINLTTFTVTLLVIVGGGILFYKLKN